MYSYHAHTFSNPQKADFLEVMCTYSDCEVVWFNRSAILVADVVFNKFVCG